MKRWHDEDDDIFCSSCCGRAMMAHEAPVYMRTNPFILRGYRQVDTRTFRSTMRALFTLSNETVNIWSHLLGVAALLACMWEWTTAGGARNLRFLEAIAWGAFFASSAACLGASTLFHLHHNCSEEASRCWLQRDLRGIMGCVAGSFLSALYYAFRCDPVAGTVYAMIAAAIAAAAASTMRPSNERTEASWVNVALISALILFGLLPSAHWAFILAGTVEYALFAWRLFVFYALLFVGAILYLSKIPERLSPGTFDYFGASHQLWHILVLMAILWWYRFLADMQLYSQRHTCGEAF